MKAKVIIELEIPEEFSGYGPWNKKTSLRDIIEHWITEGYYIDNCWVDLPEGVAYKGFEIDYPKEWRSNDRHNASKV